MRPLFLLLCLLMASPAHAQWFRKSSTYTRTPTGWVSNSGRTYTLGVDGPVSPSCPCSMCQALREALKSSSPEKVSSQDIGTPEKAIDMMLLLLQPQPNSVLLDPGCGDGRILRKAAIEYGVRGIGMEINESTYHDAKEKASCLPIAIHQGDCRSFSWEEADNVALFLYPSLISSLQEKFLSLPSGSKVISYMHPLPFSSQKKVDLGEHTFYIWKKE